MSSFTNILDITGGLWGSDLTPEVAQDLLYWPKATQTLEASQSDGHLWLVVVIGVVFRELGVQPSRKLLDGRRGVREVIILTSSLAASLTQIK